MMNSKRIGLIPGSFKPYHAGHDALIRLASSENDDVLVFASTADRPRKGELLIQGDKMRIVMEKFVKPSLNLLGNVRVIYADSPVTPVTMVFNTLNRAEQNYSHDMYTIYSDSKDIERFTHVNLRKQAPNLFDRGQIIRKGIKRGTKTPNVSGADMRRFIMTNDVEMFSKMLPEGIRSQCLEILKIL
jgi:nicotinamide mononucleotide adenylyltransferase